MNGETLEVKFDEIWQFNDVKVDWDKIDRQRFRYNMKEYVQVSPMVYEFQAIELNNDIDDKHCQLETAMMQVGF
jgi:hypothetical protein